MDSIYPIANLVIETLINSLWQGTLLFIAVICFLRKLQKLNATTRYIFLFLTLLTLAFLPFLGLVTRTAETVNLTSAYSEQERVNNDLHQEAKLGSGEDRHLLVLNKQSGNISSFGSGRITENNHKENLFRRLQHFETISIPVPFRLLPSVIFVLWILMIVLMLSRLFRSYFYVSKLRRDALISSPSYQQDITEFIKSIGIKRKIAIYITGNVRMPMVIGLVHPVILLPDDLMDRLTEEDLRHILLHESAHIRRKDDWTYLIQKIIEAFYFWNPMVLYIGRQMNLEREIACDDWVIVLSGKPKSYALCLTKLIEHGMPRPGRIIAAGTALHRGNISTRIKMLLDKGSNTSAQFSRLGVLTIISVIMIAFVLFARISNILALAEPQRDSYDPSSRGTANISVPRPLEYPKLYLSEKIYQGVRHDKAEDRVRIGEERIRGELSGTLIGDEISVSDPIALQNARSSLSQNTYQEVKDSSKSRGSADRLPDISPDNPVEAYTGTIYEVGKADQTGVAVLTTGIALLTRTTEKASEGDHLDDADIIRDTGEPYRHSSRAGVKVHKESFLEDVKISSRKVLENLSDGQEELHRKAADKLAGMEEPIVKAKGNIQNVIDKLFSAIEK